MPTECGRALIGRAELVLNDLESAKDEIAAIARGVVGRVRVGVLPVAEARLLSTTLLALRKTAPGLAVQVEDGTRDVMLNALRRGEIDCVIGRLDAGAGERDLHIEKLIQLPVAIVVSPRIALARKRRLSWPDLLALSVDLAAARRADPHGDRPRVHGSGPRAAGARDRNPRRFA